VTSLMFVDMFPHLLHTKQFLDWRFGRQDVQCTATTGAGAGAGAGAGGTAWPTMTRRRAGRRLDSQRRTGQRRHRATSARRRTASRLSTVASRRRRPSQTATDERRRVVGRGRLLSSERHKRDALTQ